MGMYTELWFGCQLKPQMVEVIEYLHASRSKKTCLPSVWAYVHRKYPELTFLNEWKHYRRADFIPFAQLDATQYSRIEGDRWAAHCELKNYEGEIDAFREVLAHLIVKPCTLFELCEEWDSAVEHLVLPEEG